MKIITLLFFLLINITLAQEKTSPLSSKIIYQNVEKRVFDLFENHRKSDRSTLFQVNDLCDQKLKFIGKYQDYFIVFVMSSFGAACRGNYKTYLLNQQSIIGYFQSDLIYPDYVKGDNLYWKSDGALNFKISLNNFRRDIETYQKEYNLGFYIINDR